ncbi:MAG: acetolactate synthase small subunit [Dehalococcoidia bacterium]|nr:acetolactate synthase small subunit [Dehalococcoidia bacterium]
MIATTNGNQEGHTITALVEDKPGVLNRITSMFRRRGYNIASLAVGPSEVPRFSRMTFVVEGDPHTLEQVSKNLNKLIDVIKVVDISDNNSVSRELALIRVRWGDQTLGEIKTIVDIFGAKIVDTAPHSLIVEVTGKSNKVDDLVENLTGIGFHVQEVMRTGMVAMSRGLSGNESGRRSQAALPKPKWESGSV